MNHVWRADCGCPACGETVRPLASLPWPKFTHVNFEVFAPPPLELAVCDNCGLGGQSLLGNVDLSGLFDDAYASRPLPIHLVHPPCADQPVPAPQHQVDILAEGLPEHPAILDIGCFDGRLLHAFHKRFPDAKLVGYDVDANRSLGDGIEYVSGGADAIKGTYDLITLSHSLQYEPDLCALFSNIKRLLAPHGTLFIQVPDIAKKPTALLLGDVHHHFTVPALCNLVKLHGFNSTVLADTGFRRDAIIQAHRNVDATGLERGGVGALEASIAELHGLAKRVRVLMNQGPWNILGTTIDAAFIYHLLGGKAGNFVDETPCLLDMTFQDRPVRHPSSLSNGERTLLPLGEDATDILQRFQKSYRGEFTLL